MTRILDKNDEANFADLNGDADADDASIDVAVDAAAVDAVVAAIDPEVTGATAPSQEMLSEPIGVPVGDGYIITQWLAKGGMGTVYVAECDRIGTRRIIKILRPELAQNPDLNARFVGEARAAAAIQHPNVVRVDGIDKLPDGRLYIKYEYVEGRTLRKHLADHVAANRTGLEVLTALQILAQICAGIERAHGLGIIHRDLKPENIMLVDQLDGTLLVKILDFGIAKLSDSVLDKRAAHTAVATRMFTKNYCAPEQVIALHLARFQSDIYSIGVIAYELVVGALPQGRPDPRIARPDLPFAWTDQIGKALQLDVHLRPEKVRDFVMPLIDASINGRAAVSQVAATFVSGLSITNNQTVRADVVLGDAPALPLPLPLAAPAKSDPAPGLAEATINAQPSTMPPMPAWPIPTPSMSTSGSFSAEFVKGLPPAPIVRSHAVAWLLVGVLLIAASALGVVYAGRRGPTTSTPVVAAVSSPPIVAPAVPASAVPVPPVPLVVALDPDAGVDAGAGASGADAGVTAGRESAESPSKATRRKRRAKNTDSEARPPSFDVGGL
jgi:serine/threonine protein kinase